MNKALFFLLQIDYIYLYFMNFCEKKYNFFRNENFVFNRAIDLNNLQCI